MIEQLKALLATWENEFRTNANGMSHLADNRIFCLREQIKELESE